ncbi:C1q-like domain-containing protein [Pseudalkalibacillus sp. R45]|uniref:C1q-like domain-containing protein n=1 Tax=Pseudalkalibacillus sp. R45 TaxID=3457433 RepID=UPI003FCC576B
MKRHCGKCNGDCLCTSNSGGCVIIQRGQGPEGPPGPPGETGSQGPPGPTPPETAFRAADTATQTITGINTPQTVTFETSVFDISASYNPATSTFTAPQAGTYNVCASVEYTVATGGGPAPTNVRLILNSSRASAITDLALVISDPGTTNKANGCTIIRLEEGDTISIQLQSSSRNVTTIIGNRFTHFEAGLIL